MKMAGNLQRDRKWQRKRMWPWLFATDGGGEEGGLGRGYGGD